MTKEFMLIDTLRYYHKHPRCANYGRCLYSSKTLEIKGTVGCAIGRFMTPKNRLKADSCNKGIIDLLKNEAHLFPKKLHNLGEDFLSACQSLHDNGINWGYMKLTQYGKKEVNEIIRRFNLKFTEEELSTLKEYIE